MRLLADRPQPSRTIGNCKAALASCAAALLATTALGQRYVVDTYQVEDGLPSGMVYSVLQDTSGVMWFATRRGVVSYDGFEWSVDMVEADFPHPKHRVVLDDQGQVWSMSGASPYRTARHAGGSWEVYPLWKAEGSGSCVALVMSGVGPVLVSSVGRVGEYSEGEWITHSALEGQGPIHTACRRGDELLLGGGRGVWSMNLKDLASPPERIESLAGVTVLVIDEVDGETVCVGDNWLGILRDDGSLTRVATKGQPRLATTPTSGVTSDGNNGWVVADLYGVTWLRADGSVRTLDRESGLATQGGTDCLRDREGNIWITSLRGVSKITHLSRETWTSAHGLLGDEVASIQRRFDGSVVLGQVGGLSVFSEAEGAAAAEIATVDLGGDAISSRIMDMVETKDGRVVLASGDLGLLELSAEGEVSEYSLSMPWPHALSLDGDELWVGGSSGLWRSQGGGPLEQVDLMAGHTTGVPTVRRVIEARSGAHWVAMLRRGVARVDTDLSVTHYLGPDPLWNDAFSLIETEDGRILAATSVGLAFVEGERLEPVPLLTPEMQTLTRAFFLLLEGPAGTFWAGSDRGLARWDESEGSVEWITPTNGLAGPETNRAAGMIDERGRIWVGTDGGLTILDIEGEPARPHGPTIELLELDDGRRVHALSEEDVVLRAGHPALSWKFRAISFVDEESVLFRYRLIGFDDRWNGPVELPTRSVRYTNLSSGFYKLEIQAIDRYGRTSEVVSSPRILIRSALIDTYWFRGILALMVIAVTGGFVKLVLGKRNARQLEIVVNERTRELADSRRALTAALESIADGLCAVSKEGVVSLWNPSAARLIGLSQEEAISSPVGDVFGDEVAAWIDEVRESPKTPELSLRLDLAGASREFQFSAAPLESGEEDLGVIIAFRDITRRLQLERDAASVQRMQSIGLLAGGIAHDFNNYLTVIHGTLGLLTDRPEIPTGLREQVVMAEQTLDRAASLTRQLLTFSTGGAPLRESVSVEHILNEAGSFVLSGSNVSYSVEVAPDMAPARADAGQVLEVLHNLLLNARQAMPEGGHVRLSARDCVDTPPGLLGTSYVEIEVEDNGPGISAEDLPRLFEPFFTLREGGTGLGLAVAQSVVARHDGNLSVDSLVGRGSIFRIVLPAHEGPVSSLVEEDLPAVAGARVLVMDDEPPIISILSRMLERLGCSTHVTYRGEDAVEAFIEAQSAGAPFDTAILDLTVPGAMGGREAAKLILTDDPSASLIVTSGYSTDAVLGRYEQHGFVARLSKPFRLRDLQRALAKALACSSSGNGAGGSIS